MPDTLHIQLGLDFLNDVQISMQNTDTPLPDAPDGLPVVGTAQDAKAAVRDLFAEDRQLAKRQARIKIDRLKVRYRVGFVVSRLREIGTYGDDAVGWLSGQTGRSRRVLYQCRQFYAFIHSLDVSLSEWLEKQDYPSWTTCRKRARRALRVAGETEEEKRQREMQDLRDEAKTLEEQAFDLDEKTEQMQARYGETEAVREARGVADLMKEKASEYRRQVQPHSPQGDAAPRLEDEDYLDRVRRYECVCCGQPGAVPHHVESSGTGAKTHDSDTIPLCQTHHDEYHRSDPEAFNERWDLDPWFTAHRIFQEYAYDLPVGTLLPQPPATQQ
jgi:hypothetical protein